MGTIYYYAQPDESTEGQLFIKGGPGTKITGMHPIGIRPERRLATIEALTANVRTVAARFGRHSAFPDYLIIQVEADPAEVAALDAIEGQPFAERFCTRTWTGKRVRDFLEVAP